MGAHQQGYEAYAKLGMTARNPYSNTDRFKADAWAAGFAKARKEQSQ